MKTNYKTNDKNTLALTTVFASLVVVLSASIASMISMMITTSTEGSR